MVESGMFRLKTKGSWQIIKEGTPDPAVMIQSVDLELSPQEIVDEIVNSNQHVIK